MWRRPNPTRSASSGDVSPGSSSSVRAISRMRSSTPTGVRRGSDWALAARPPDRG